MPLSTFNKLIDQLIIAKGDSGATKHYLTSEDSTILLNKQVYHGKGVTIPNSTQLKPSHQGLLPLSNLLTSAAKTATVLPQLSNSSLISMGQLCDDGCEVKLTRKKLSVTKNNMVVMEGHRNYTDGLWDIPIIKSSITSYKHLPQAHHAGLYNTITRTPLNIKPIVNIRSTKKTSSYKPIVTLPSVKDCETIIKEQLYQIINFSTQFTFNQISM